MVGLFPTLFCYNIFSILAFRHHVNAIRSHLRKKVTLKNNKDMDCILPKIGTHNSATGEKGKGLISLLATPFSKCQGRDIASQINMGCRYFDIRFAIDKHGI